MTAQQARQIRRSRSNNPKNPNKNVCAFMVAWYLGVHDKVHYLHTMKDLVRAVRKRFKVRSRKSSLKSSTVGGNREVFRQITQDTLGTVLGYIVGVPGHVIFVDPDGKTVVDTSPRKRDSRKVTHAYVVYLEPKIVPLTKQEIFKN